MKIETFTRPRFQLLSEDQRSRVAETAMEILERTGVRLSHTSALELLDGAGARIEQEHGPRAAGFRAHIPGWMVEDALRSAPSRVLIYDRDGRPAMRLGEGRVYFGANMDAPVIFDPLTHDHHLQTEADCRMTARLFDAMPNLSFLMAAGFSADRPASIADRFSARAALMGTRRPVLTITLSRDSLVAAREMTALMVGSDEALRARPCLMHYSEPISPLLHPDESVEKLFYCADWGIPLVYTPYLAMGATAPCSISGMLAQACAESLSGLVIHQLRRRGAPFIFGAMPSAMDMKTMVFSYAAPEFQAACAGMAEMARHFGLPNFGTAGCGDTNRLDGQAILEATSMCYMAALSGADLIHDTGLFGGAQVLIPEMYLVVDELAGMLRRLLGTISTDDAALSGDAIDEVGPGGDYVGHPTTLAGFRQIWHPALMERVGYSAWNMAQTPTYEQRLQTRARAILSQPVEPAWSSDELSALDEMERRWISEVPR